MCLVPCLELLLFSAYPKIKIMFRGVENRKSINDNSHKNNCKNDKGNNNKITVCKQCKGKGLFTVHTFKHCIWYTKLTTKEFNWANFVKLGERKFLPVHAMRFYRWRRETDPPVLNLGTDGGECRASPSGRFKHGERISCNHWIGGANKKIHVRECEVMDLFSVCNLKRYTWCRTVTTMKFAERCPDTVYTVLTFCMLATCHDSYW